MILMILRLLSTASPNRVMLDFCLPADKLKFNETIK